MKTSLEVKTYSNYTNVYKHLYASFKFYLLLALCGVAFLINHWLSHQLGWWYILIPIFFILALLTIPLQNILKHGPKQRICHLAFDEIITEEDRHIPINEIKSVEFIANSNRNGYVYSIFFILNNGIRPELILEIDVKTMILIHRDLKKEYLSDKSFIYLYNKPFSGHNIYSSIEDIL